MIGKKRSGFFKRIGQPTVIMLGSTPKLVKTNDIIHADYDFMMTQDGWLFEPRFDPKKAQAAQPKLKQRSIQDTIKMVHIPQPVSISPAIRVEVRAAPLNESKAVEIVINIDKLKALKVLSNKEWIKLTKADCIAILQEANADFSHVPQTKWELVKFIKALVKDI